MKTASKSLAFSLLFGIVMGYIGYSIENDAERKPNSTFNSVIAPEHIRQKEHIGGLRTTRHLILRFFVIHIAC